MIPLEIHKRAAARAAPTNAQCPTCSLNRANLPRTFHFKLKLTINDKRRKINKAATQNKAPTPAAKASSRTRLHYTIARFKITAAAKTYEVIASSSTHGGGDRSYKKKHTGS